MIDSNKLNEIQAILLDFEGRDHDTLTLVATFIHGLDLSEEDKYAVWARWLDAEPTSAQDSVYDDSKGSATVTLEEISELASKAVEASIHNTKDSLANFEVDYLNFTTPKAVAKQFTILYRKPLKYVIDLDKWLEWNGSRWEVVEEAYLISVLGNVTDKLLKKHIKIDQYEEKDLRAFSKMYNKISGLKEVLKTLKAQSEIEILSKDLDNDSTVIGCVNGAVDLTTGDLVASRREQYLTKSTGVIYNPEATCPRWEQTVSEVFLDDPEMIGFFKKLVGYSMLGNPTEDLLVIPYGAGANGKSTIFNTLATVFGEYGRSTAFSTFTTSSTGSQHREDLVRLQGSRFVYTSEPDAFGQLKEGLVKTITGGDTLTARTAYARKSVEITPNWVTFIPTNHKPMIKGVDEGIWRRLLFIPFKRNFRLEPELLDINLSDKLAAEKQGILRWIIEGGLEYQQDGLIIPEALIEDKNEYRKELDVVGSWIEDKCETGDNYRESNKNLWESFLRYTKERGYETDISSSQKLSNNLNSRGFERAKRDSTGIRGFLGIRVI